MKDWLRHNRGFLVFLALFGLFRSAIADWNPIPSGSMRPTLLEGDVVLVNRVAYDLKVPFTDVSLWRLGEPERGDVVTFSSPTDGTRLIKRVVALGGDVVAMRNGMLMVNGAAAAYTEAQGVADEPIAPGLKEPAWRLRETLGRSSRVVQYLPQRASMRSFDPVTVPHEHVLVLGDSRDNSVDSRYYGFVARHALVGRAHRILVSADTGRWQLRTERIGSKL